MRIPLALALLLAHPARASDADPWLGADKAKHFGATWLLATAGYGGASLATDDTAWRLGSGAALAMGAGVAKELWDLSGRGSPSWRDLAWDGVGTAAGLVTAYAFDRAWQAITGEPVLLESR